MENIEELTPDFKQGIQQLLTQRASIETNIRMYMQGYMDAKGLKGEWNLDTNNWVLKQAPAKEDKENVSDA